MIYKIEITEILQKVVKVEADTVEEALGKVEDKYCRAEIILDADDMKDYTIEEFQEC